MRLLSSSRSSSLGFGRESAFSLIELLVVIGIIGILAAISLPALRGLMGGNAVDAAKRQLIDDLTLARQRAMNERTTVFVVFVPPGLKELNQPKQSLTNLYSHQLTSYALYTKRAVGDQPGSPRPRYLTEWRHLPEGVFIPEFKYDSSLAALLNTNEYLRGLPVTNTAYYFKQGSNTIPYRYLAFNAQGQLDTPSRRDEVIPVAKGSIFNAKDGSVDVQPTPPGNHSNNWIRVTALTGRARGYQPEIK